MGQGRPILKNLGFLGFFLKLKILKSQNFSFLGFLLFQVKIFTFSGHLFEFIEIAIIL